MKLDSIGNPRIVEATPQGGSPETTSYTYNSDISLATITEFDGKEFGFAYDRLMRVKSINKHTGTTQIKAQNYVYNDAGQLIQTSLDGIAKASVTYGYNQDGQLRFLKRGNTWYTLYTYDETDGRLTGMYNI